MSRAPRKHPGADPRAGHADPEPDAPGSAALDPGVQEREHKVLLQQFAFICQRHDILLDKLAGALAAAGLPLNEAMVLREREVGYVNRAFAQIGAA